MMMLCRKMRKLFALPAVLGAIATSSPSDAAASLPATVLGDSNSLLDVIREYHRNASAVISVWPRECTLTLSRTLVREYARALRVSRLHDSLLFIHAHSS